MTLQTDLERIVELAGTDPRYPALIEALMEECPSCVKQAMSGDDSINTHMAGCIKGRVLRLKWQQGELARVLLDWADKHVPYEPAKSSPQLHTALVLCFREPDTNERATQVFVKFMEATHATDPSAA